MVAAGNTLKQGVWIQILPVIPFVTQAIPFNQQFLICKIEGDNVDAGVSNAPSSSLPGAT